MKVNNSFPETGQASPRMRKTPVSTSGTSSPEAAGASSDQPTSSLPVKVRSAVTLSQTALQMSDVSLFADSGLITRIQNDIREGKYRANSEKIADRLIATIADILPDPPLVKGKRS